MEGEPHTIPTQTHVSPGGQLGPYRVEALLGVGGMGEVFRAVDTRLGRTVALKMVRPDLAGRADFRQRFEREARAISAVNHSHICTLYDIGEQDGSAYLVMEFVEGDSLAVRLREGPLPIDLVTRYGAQAARALAAAHARGIIHRDLKPANIMLTAHGVKVLDFGLAKTVTALCDPERETGSIGNAVVGTPAYMSPEQTRAEVLDERSDIFSLGCVLYEAACGCAPFRGPSILAILHEIAVANPPAPSAIRPELPQEFDLVVERALAKDRAGRYHDAEELAQILEALGQPSGRTAPAAHHREPEELVGREAELRKLAEHLGEAAAGSGKTVLLTGEPGIGKTALAGAFLYSLRGRPEILVGRGACVEQYGTGEAYLPFLDALSGLLAGGARERVLAVLRRHAPTWCLQFPSMFASTGAMEQLQRETIGATKQRMLRELGDALGQLASASPVVMLLEDLHWADASSIDLLRYLSERARGQRLLIVGTARPEDVERSNPALRNAKRELAAHGACLEIELHELGQEHIARYLATRFRPNDFPADFPALIHRKTEGHPLFATGAVQLLVERGDITRTGDTWILSRPLSEMDLQVPASIRSMIVKQLEVLEEEDRRALQYASVEGEEFSSTIVAGLLGCEELDLEERLSRVDRMHRLIRTLGEDELPDGSMTTRYRFAHALYQNLIYEDLLSKRRVLLHRQAGEILVRCYRGQTARVAAALATHFERGRDFSRAIEYLMEAAKVAASRYANAEAEQHYTRALCLVEKLPSEQQAPLRVTLHHRRGTTRLAAAQYPEAAADFDRMLDGARAMGDSFRECTALIALADAHFYAHRIPAMGQRAQEALDIAERLGDQVLRSESMAQLARKSQVIGELTASRKLYDRSIAIGRAIQHRQLSMQLTYSGALHFFQTEYATAESVLTEASRLASELRDGVNLPQCLFFLGITRGNLGHISPALATLHEALEMSRCNGAQMVACKIPNCLGWLHRELQDFESMLQYDREALEVSRKHRILEAEANALINLVQDYTCIGESERAAKLIGEVEAIRNHDAWHAWRFFDIRLQAATAEYCLSQGQLEQAARHARLLLANSNRQRTPKYITVAHKTLAEIALAAGDYATAEAELGAAFVQMETHPAPLVAWKCLAILGRLRLRMGDGEAARQAFAKGASIAEDIASTIADQRLRAVFLDSPAVRALLQGDSGIGMAAC